MEAVKKEVKEVRAQNNSPSKFLSNTKKGTNERHQTIPTMITYAQNLPQIETVTTIPNKPHQMKLAPQPNMHRGTQKKDREQNSTKLTNL